MFEAQHHCMQGLSLKRIGASGRSVHGIAEKRMSDMCHVDPDLMRAAGFKPAFNIRVCAKPFQNTIMGHRPFSPSRLTDSHLLPVSRMPRQRCVDHALILLQISGHDCPITPCNRVVMKLHSQTLVGFIIFSSNKRPGCVPINPVYDSRSQNPIDPGQASPAMIKQRIDKRAGHMTGGRMHNHSVCLRR